MSGNRAQIYDMINTKPSPYLFYRDSATSRERDAFEDAKFPELSKVVQYFKETEGGFGEMCKTVEDYAKKYAKDYAKEREKIVREEGRSEGLAEGRSEERKNAIRKMLESGLSREMILSMDYSETELEAVEQELFAQV